jgi:hypothetical protein
MISGYQGILNTVSASIANGGTESSALNLKGFSLAGIFMPAAFTGTAISFKASTAIDGTFEPVYNSSGAVSYTVAASRYVAIDPKDFQGIQFLKVVSGSAEGAARTLTLSLKGL